MTLRKPWFLVGAWLALALAATDRWHSSLQNPSHTTDFAPVYEAAGKLLHGGTLYGGGLGSFVYLPSTALIFVPFRALTLPDAASLSIALQLASLTLASCLIVRRFGRNPVMAPLSATIIVLSEPTLSAEIFGNVDLFIPLVVAACAVFVDSERELPAGAVYGLSIAMKPMVVVPAVIALLRQRWRFLGIAALVVGALSAPVILETSTGRFFSQTLPFLASGEPSRIVQVQSIAIASVLRNEPRLLSDALRVASAVLALVASYRLWRRSQAPLGIRWLEATVAGQLGLALVSGFTFSHHVATALLLLPAAASSMSLTRRPPVLLALLLLALPRPLPLWSIQQQQCTAMVLVLAATLWSLRRTATEVEAGFAVGPEPELESHIGLPS